MQRTLHRLLPRFSERLPLRAGKRQNVRPFLWRFMGVIIFTNEDNAKTPPKRLQKRLITGSKDYCGQPKAVQMVTDHWSLQFLELGDETRCK
jgi:hypothetical protein